MNKAVVVKKNRRIKLLLLKNIIITVSYDENTVTRKKLHRKPGLINIWSARGLSLYGKVTIIKSLFVPKFVYVSSLLTTPGGLSKN